MDLKTINSKGGIFTTRKRIVGGFYAYDYGEEDRKSVV